MEIRQLETFVHVASASFSRAAEVLGIHSVSDHCPDPVFWKMSWKQDF